MSWNISVSSLVASFFRYHAEKQTNRLTEVKTPPRNHRRREQQQFNDLFTTQEQIYSLSCYVFVRMCVRVCR